MQVKNHLENAKLIMLNNGSGLFLVHLKNKIKVILISSYMCWRLLLLLTWNFPEHSINIQYKYNISVKQ